MNLELTALACNAPPSPLVGEGWALPQLSRVNRTRK